MKVLNFLIFVIFVKFICAAKAASIRKSTRINVQEDLNAEADSLIYKPKTYHYYQIQNRHIYPTQQQQVYTQPYYYQQPVYYQQPSYYYPQSYYPSYPSAGGFGFNFCLTCFSLGFGKK
uniref:Uncharacterized protein n=1 Tax=Panagrolaimus sp. PS1159 TaxID=55785 RepID=A0AC35GCQ8_9BILA